LVHTFVYKIVNNDSSYDNFQSLNSSWTKYKHWVCQGNTLYYKQFHS